MDKEYLENLVGPEAAADIWQKHEAALSAQRLEQAISGAVKRLGGRSEPAIRALLDRQALEAGGDPEEAVAALKKQNPWLFAPPQVSSPGTGAMTVTQTPSLEDVGKMSMAEYKRYRQSR